MIKAIMKDLDDIKELYKKIVNETPDMEKYAKWIWSMHPTEKMIEDYVKDGSMYIYFNQEEIIGAMAVTMRQGVDYHGIEWKNYLNDDEVAVIHILGVNPDYQKQGVCRLLIDEAISIAKTNGKKALRLDALATNTPAHRIYLSKGFLCMGRQYLYATNTGWTDFFYFELDL